MWLRSVLAVLLFLSTSCFAEYVLDLSGNLSLQGRYFPHAPAFSEQLSDTGGIVTQGTIYGELGPNTSFKFTPHYRYDSADSRRTHADVREAYLLTYGDWAKTSWEVRVGLGRVFWGVSELHNLVDVVNQLDLVEHPRNRPKLGQPMLHFTISGSWGIAESFVLPYHRSRTFPGLSGRLRSRFPISESAVYESDREEQNVDYAFRYGHSLGLLDFGLSGFSGTNREPFFIFDSQPTPHPFDLPTLVPYYEQIQQFGLDAQITTELLLYKFEGIYREGSRNLLGEEEAFNALILGAEHTVFDLFESAASLTLLAEWLYDERGERATSVWANDLFLAGFLSFNDVQGTELVGGLLSDLDHDSIAVNLEFKRRISNSWLFRVESIVNLRSDPEDLTYDGRRDSFFGIDFTVNF